MLGLTSREEFRGKCFKGTAIEMSNDQRTGTAQIAAQQFLAITPRHQRLIKVDDVIYTFSYLANLIGYVEIIAREA